MALLANVSRVRPPIQSDVPAEGSRGQTPEFLQRAEAEMDSVAQWFFAIHIPEPSAFLAWRQYCELNPQDNAGPIMMVNRDTYRQPRTDEGMQSSYEQRIVRGIP